eukprot:4913356-Pyramimonas_sp.AAC.1
MVIALVPRTFVFKLLQELHGLRTGRFQNGGLALAPRTFVPQVGKSFTDRGQVVFKMWFSPWPRADSFHTFARASRTEG